MQTVKNEVTSRAAEVKRVSYKMRLVTTEVKNNSLKAMAEAILKNKEEIIFRNSIDVEAAKETGLSGAFIERLIINENTIDSMVRGLQDIISLPDPVGEIIEEKIRPNGLKIAKVRVPIGAIAIIYESRPNVTVDAVGLVLKSGNTILLRGGTEAINTNHTLVKIIAAAAYSNGIPQGAIQFVETTDREAVQEIIGIPQYLDLIIPRGGRELIRMIIEKARVPVITHGEGICHIYVDAGADLVMAENISYNAKCQRPGVCNAMECLLVHRAIADKFLPSIAKRYQAAGVEIRGDSTVCSIVPQAVPASDEDWGREFLSLILAMKVVDSLEEALEHIARYGSGHSDAIITEEKSAAEKFLQEVDSAAVYHNASTRFTDGGEFGLGAEIGISTQKLHARGPMGLKELTSYKYIIRGYGQIRE